MNTYDYTYKKNKKKLTLSVDEGLVALDKKNKINISAFLEQKLKETLLREWARPDLNRGSSPRKGDVITN